MLSMFLLIAIVNCADYSYPHSDWQTEQLLHKGLHPKIVRFRDTGFRMLPPEFLSLLNSDTFEGARLEEFSGFILALYEKDAVGLPYALPNVYDEETFIDFIFSMAQNNNLPIPSIISFDFLMGLPSDHTMPRSDMRWMKLLPSNALIELRRKWSFDQAELKQFIHFIQEMFRAFGHLHEKGYNDLAFTKWFAQLMHKIGSFEDAMRIMSGFLDCPIPLTKLSDSFLEMPVDIAGAILFNDKADSIPNIRQVVREYQQNNACEAKRFHSVLHQFETVEEAGQNSGESQGLSDHTQHDESDATVQENHDSSHSDGLSGQSLSDDGEVVVLQLQPAEPIVEFVEMQELKSSQKEEELTLFDSDVTVLDADTSTFIMMAEVERLPGGKLKGNSTMEQQSIANIKRVWRERIRNRKEIMKIELRTDMKLMKVRLIGERLWELKVITVSSTEDGEIWMNAVKEVLNEFGEFNELNDWCDGQHEWNRCKKSAKNESKKECALVIESDIDNDDKKNEDESKDEMLVTDEIEQANSEIEKEDELEDGMWSCSACTFVNAKECSICSVCTTPNAKYEHDPTIGNIDEDFRKDNEVYWECSVCTVLNENDRLKCKTCGAYNLAMFRDD